MKHWQGAPPGKGRPVLQVPREVMQTLLNWCGL
jgi:hypothetical protein